MTRLIQPLFAIVLLVTPASALAQLRAELVDEGFDRPVAVVADPHAASGSETLIVVEQPGLAWALVDGERQPTPFLDLRSEVRFLVEQGMLGLAFDPVDPNQVYVSFSKRRPIDDGLSDTVIARFNRSADPLVLDQGPTSRKDFVFPGTPPTPFIPQGTTVHKGGDLHFGPDGYLYVGIGDGGAGTFPGGNAQHPGSLLGKFLRLDVNVPDDDPKGYRVPADNPFVPYQHLGVLPEIWSFGFRNPWRWSFDDFPPGGATNAMIIGDVGEGSREEIDYEPAGRGGRNYGWYLREGTIPTPGWPPGSPAFEPLTPPMVDYPRTIGRSVTGGFVYRGALLPPRYSGRYFVADYFGRVFSLGLAIAANGEAQVADVLDHTAELGSPRFISTFGRGTDGELYFTNLAGGRVLKIVPSPVEAPAPPVNTFGEVSGSTVRISWQNGATGGSPTGFVLEAGSRSGAADLLTTPVAFSPLVVDGVPNGLYYVRVRALNDQGTSTPSNEVEVLVGCVAPPAAPTGPVATVSGNTVSLQWTAAAQATSYLVEAGVGTGETIASFPVATPSLAGPVASGTYFVRVRAVNQCGTSTPSEEIVVTVP